MSQIAFEPSGSVSNEVTEKDKKLKSLIKVFASIIRILLFDFFGYENIFAVLSPEYVRNIVCHITFQLKRMLNSDGILV